jgi:4-aminobutyrate aminotransferase-like enzyme/Ser/Thr protein kinase RdoA (MazF antagonist)
VAIAATRFGISATARELPAELDRNYLLQTGDGTRYVMKISPGTFPEQNLSFQVAALELLGKSRMADRVPAVQRSDTGESLLRLSESDGAEHWVRVLSYLDGQPLARLVEHRAELLIEIGRFLARINQVMLGFDHPGARRHIAWDMKRALELRNSLELITDRSRRDLVAGHLDHFAEIVVPRFPELDHSVIHNDANDYNLLVSDLDPQRARLCGLIDFGDMVHSLTIAELAIACAYIMLDKPSPWSAAEQVVSGYHSLRPLTAVEQELLPDLILTRLCMSTLMAARAMIREPDNPYLIVSQKPVWNLLERLAMSHSDEARELIARVCDGKRVRPRSAEEIVDVRKRHMGYNLSISYQKPLKIVRGRGQYLYDDSGRRYLDLVNNVCHVGHCHPQVVAAAQTQMAELNTNTRYLHDNLAEYVLRLTGTLPEALSVCYLVCTGTEANDLALRLARAHTGSREIIVLDHAYHGHSPSLVEISPYKCNGPGGEGLAAHAHKVTMPDTYRGPFTGSEAGQRYAAEVARAVAAIRGAGRQVGAFMAESLIGCGGQIMLPERFLEEAYHEVRAAGGVCIADEVQVGFGRVGSHMWAFATQGVVPDIVTLGKPIGNGHPLAAVITTPEIAASFNNGMEYFNTFGGNPVSCAVGLAVLDVIEAEGLQQHALTMGERLLQGLRRLQTRHELIGDVRGRGLFIGIELVKDRESLEPAAEEAAGVIERMKEHGFLISTDGPHHNVLKIKPPLVLQADDIDRLLATLDEVL